MSTPLIEKINIYITVDLQTINNYFNAHDPSPLYKRKVNQKFEQYILNDVSSAKRYSAIFYKLNCIGAVNKQYAEPLMHALHRHFAIKKEIREDEFKKFKRRNLTLLAISSAIVIICEAFLPLLFKNIGDIYDGLKNCLDVFSWVILWKPIYELLFSWNPYLKDILLLSKLATAEVIIVDNSKKSVEPEQPVKYRAPDVEVSKSVTYESLLSN